MNYGRFFAMIATSTVVMFGLMYLNTYALEHVFWSETRAWMALLMGATMAIVMLAWMLGMYPSRAANLGIFAGAAVVFAASLWLVRSQATVDGESYMRAMIPHHSIAVMTSERAGIEDARVRKLADQIIAAQRREIAEMRYLIAAVDAGEVRAERYRDPAPTPGTVDEALSRVNLAALDPAPLSREEARETGLAPSGGCAFRTSRRIDPILWTADGAGAMKLNGVLVALEAGAEAGTTGGVWQAEGVRMEVAPLGEEADWRADAELVFQLDQGLEAGFRGTWTCGT
ncbi:DUF305 domain-containing protein [Albimonas pacifica]|uniref:DUF305 domain-containing protein n=1 Tax=Albimonas pacifica TaxID=1114924 RepID=A0A1I3P7H3_9RHOB|nr:DUF305 domain-containing protein [Albimonas pacifica]SFJ16986.1 protein of unknown function [Albimonas pacifica]